MLVVVAHREGIAVVEVGMRKVAVGKQLLPNGQNKKCRKTGETLCVTILGIINNPHP